MVEIVDIREGKTIVLEPKGRLDNNTSATFERKIEVVTQGEAPTIVIDCTELTYVSSSGLRGFLKAAKRIDEAQGQLVICSLRPHVKEVFDVSGFSRFLNIRATRKEAITQTVAPRSGRRISSRPIGGKPVESRPLSAGVSARAAARAEERMRQASAVPGQAPVSPIATVVEETPSAGAPPSPRAGGGRFAPPPAPPPPRAGGGRIAPPPPPPPPTPGSAPPSSAGSGDEQSAAGSQESAQPARRLTGSGVTRANKPAGFSR